MSVFDGMAGLLNDVLGSPVTFVDSATGAQTTVTAMFREEPVEVISDQGGAVLIEQPTVRVPRNLAPGIRRGDTVVLANGRQYRVESKIGTGSPASDRFTVCTLELIT